MKTENYYLGLDVGTDSVGYAVTDYDYHLIKYSGEPMWGSHVFEEAQLADERRTARTARRRLDRRQQRIQLLDGLFASEINAVDPKFFRRIDESSLWNDDKSDPTDSNCLFFDIGFKDKEFHNQYPTIHHLICDILNSGKTFDVRLVYLACRWLIVHRGHFLYDVDKENIGAILDFGEVYSAFISYFDEIGQPMPWNCDVDRIGSVMSQKRRITDKEKDLKKVLFDGKKPNDYALCDLSLLIKLLAGGIVDFSKLFKNDEYTDLKGSLGDSDKLEATLPSLKDDDRRLIELCKGIFDWAVLSNLIPDGDDKSLSAAKVAVYNQHKADLADLKRIIRKYKKSEYNSMFRDLLKDNYVAYSKNYKSLSPKGKEALKNADKTSKCKKEDFCKHVKSVLSGITVNNSDEALVKSMIERCELLTFMPKQVDSDNRVIPYQLYWDELKKILEKAKVYLPFIACADENGITTEEKILSIMSFRVPYYVGPTNTHSDRSWIVRKGENKVYPWNYDSEIDLNASENAFIDRMTGNCSYLFGEKVLPKSSLLYSRFNVLNEINNLKINGVSVPVELKHKIYTSLFEKKARVSKKDIVNLMISEGAAVKSDIIEGTDTTIKSSLKSYCDFSEFITSGKLTEEDCENIIYRITCTDDKIRLRKWLTAEFSTLSPDDIKKISSFKYKDFGRLSKRLLTNVYDFDRKTGETSSLIDMMWNTNLNLMQLLSDDYGFTDEIRRINREEYSHPENMSDWLDSYYVSNSVKRQIIRTLDVVSDVVKATGNTPKKIFIEMSRGGEPEKKGKKTQSRKETITELYNSIDKDRYDISSLIESLNNVTENELQSDVMFLYFTQLGRCMYTGETIDIKQLKTLYNREHIYPQSRVKDDSILNNLVLVRSEINEQKDNIYPISAEIRSRMTPYWEYLKEKGLISDEKFRRLTRATSFSDDEKWGFINRQLVETRQSTKVIAEVLKELYPNTEIVYSKAGLVSEFRQVFDIPKVRSVNDLHHAKDAYLNIVVGNVYHERFTRKWFLENSDTYNVETKYLFTNKVISSDGRVIWKGVESKDEVVKITEKNNIHFTRYQFCRKGAYFDLMPLKASESLFPRKKNLPAEKYGGYNKTTASFFVLVKYTSGRNTDVIFMPVELLYSDRFMSDNEFAEEYTRKTICDIIGKDVADVSFPLGIKKLKVNTLVSVDGLQYCITGKSGGGKQLTACLMIPLILSKECDNYIRRLEHFSEKKKENNNLVIHEEWDKISKSENLKLYDIITEKLTDSLFSSINSCYCQGEILQKNRSVFEKFSAEIQTDCLLTLVSLLKTGRNSGCDLTAIGGAGKAGVISLNSRLSNWKCKEAYIINTSASGIYEKKSVNLMELL